MENMIKVLLILCGLRVGYVILVMSVKILFKVIELILNSNYVGKLIRPINEKKLNNMLIQNILFFRIYESENKEIFNAISSKRLSKSQIEYINKKIL